MSSDLQYLTGVPRDFPNYGNTIHPGDWLEGAWITPKHAPVLPLPRMTAEFGGLSRLEGIDIRVLGDWDEPAEMVKLILADFNLPDNPPRRHQRLRHRRDRPRICSHWYRARHSSPLQRCCGRCA